METETSLVGADCVGMLYAVAHIGLYFTLIVYPCDTEGHDAIRHAKTLNEVASAARPPFSLVFGNEASGLPARFAQMGQSVFIPQSDEIDSLNLAVAVSVGSYVFMHGVKEHE